MDRGRTPSQEHRAARVPPAAARPQPHLVPSTTTPQHRRDHGADPAVAQAARHRHGETADQVPAAASPGGERRRHRHDVHRADTRRGELDGRGAMILG